jgi:hypothetical protein
MSFEPQRPMFVSSDQTPFFLNDRTGMRGTLPFRQFAVDEAQHEIIVDGNQTGVRMYKDLHRGVF